MAPSSGKGLLRPLGSTHHIGCAHEIIGALSADTLSVFRADSRPLISRRQVIGLARGAKRKRNLRIARHCWMKFSRISGTWLCTAWKSSGEATRWWGSPGAATLASPWARA
ncbi:unnamed protein product [Ixodes pacificus]